MDSSYLIQTLQIKKMLGEITKEENEWLETVLTAENQTLDSWLENHHHGY